MTWCCEIGNRLEATASGPHPLRHRIELNDASIKSQTIRSNDASIQPVPVEADYLRSNRGLNTKSGLSIITVTGLSSLRDELPEFRRNVLELIGSL